MQPDVELSCQINLAHPEVDHVKVVIEENLRLVRGGNFHIVVASCEVPLGLAHELQSRNLIQVDDVVRLMRELIGRLVRDEDAFNRIEIDEAQVLCQLSHVHL